MTEIIELEFQEFRKKEFGEILKNGLRDWI